METSVGNVQAVSNQSVLEAYQSVLPEIRAVADESLLPVNIDVATTVTTVIGAVSKINAIRPSLENLRYFDALIIHKLRPLAVALAYLNGQYLAVLAPVGTSMVALGEEGAKCHETLLSYATAFATSGHVAQARLQELNGTVGYRNLAMSLFALTSIHREVMIKLGTKYPLSAAEIDAADVIALQLLDGVAERDQSAASVAEVTQNRQRTFTLLVKTYNQVRRAVCYVRWDEGDADDITPSLYAGRNTGKRNVVPEPTPAPTPEPSPTPAPAPALIPVPQPPVANAVPTGHPGESPYIS